MITLNPNSIDVLKAKRLHSNSIVCSVLRKLNGSFPAIHTKECNVCLKLHSPQKTKETLTYDHILNRSLIEEIVNLRPEEMFDFNSNLYSLIPQASEAGYLAYLNLLKRKNPPYNDTEKRTITFYTNLNNSILEVFNWDLFTYPDKTGAYNATKFLETINKNTCVYCNRNYTSKVVGVEKVNGILREKSKAKIRPQIDHWYPKSKYPFLALSFYNLIPSCETCNGTAIKGDKQLSIKEHWHPYIDDGQNEFKFSFKFSVDSKHSTGITSYVKTNNSKAKKTIDFFEIENVYKVHDDELADLIYVKRAFSDRYLEILSENTYPELNLNTEELYRLAFGVYYDVSDYHKRPLSKMKKDVLSELKII